MLTEGVDRVCSLRLGLEFHDQFLTLSQYRSIFKVPEFLSWMVIVGDRESMDDIRKAPEHVLSATAFVEDVRRIHSLPTMAVILMQCYYPLLLSSRKHHIHLARKQCKQRTTYPSFMAYSPSRCHYCFPKFTRKSETRLWTVLHPLQVISLATSFTYPFTIIVSIRMDANRRPKNDHAHCISNVQPNLRGEALLYVFCIPLNTDRN